VTTLRFNKGAYYSRFDVLSLGLTRKMLHLVRWQRPYLSALRALLS
jgi:hypothetical protein